MIITCVLRMSCFVLRLHSFWFHGVEFMNNELRTAKKYTEIKMNMSKIRNDCKSSVQISCKDESKKGSKTVQKESLLT